jgi:hypothetical protein
MVNSITPPPELVKQWLWSDDYSLGPLITITSNRLQNVATQAAQWGADQELKACCEWFSADVVSEVVEIVSALRAARRPSLNPPSLKELALHALGSPTKIGESRVIEHRDHDLLRRALEALPDD